MAALTVDSTIGLGSKCFGDPEVVHPPLVILRREVDISKCALAENTNFELMPVPKGFLALFIAVDQTEYTDQAATVTFATKKADTAAIGGDFALAASSTKLRSIQPVASTNAKDSAGTGTVAVPGTKLFTADDSLCLKVPNSLTDDKLVEGKFSVALIGYMPFGDSADFGNGDTPMRTATPSDLDNTASADYDD